MVGVCRMPKPKDGRQRNRLYYRARVSFFIGKDDEERDNLNCFGGSYNRQGCFSAV